jgi:hypothetical protein
MMGLTTYHKLLRQCKLLDNKFILSDADVLFTKMDAEHNDGYIHFQQFKTLLKHIGAYKFKREAVEAAHLKVRVFWTPQNILFLAPLIDQEKGVERRCEIDAGSCKGTSHAAEQCGAGYVCGIG